MITKSVKRKQNTVCQPGLTLVPIPTTRVKAGDMLGIHYEDKSGKAVVRFEDNYHKSNADPTIALSATVGIDKVYNEGLPVGHELTTADQHSHKGKRAPALFPVFNRSKYGSKYSKLKNTIEIQLVRLTEVCGKVLSEKRFCYEYS